LQEEYALFLANDDLSALFLVSDGVLNVFLVSDDVLSILVLTGLTALVLGILITLFLTVLVLSVLVLSFLGILASPAVPVLCTPALALPHSGATQPWSFDSHISTLASATSSFPSKTHP